MQLGLLRQESSERDGIHSPSDIVVPDGVGSEVLSAGGVSPTREVLAQTYKKYGKLEDTPAGKDILGHHDHLNELLPTLNEKVAGLLRGQEKVFGTFGSEIVQEAHFQLNSARADAETAKSMAARCGIPPSDPAFFKARRLEAELERYMIEAVRLHKLSLTFRAEIEEWRAKVEELRENRPELTSVIKSARRQNHLFEAVGTEVDPSGGVFELGGWREASKRRRPASEPAKQAQGRPDSETAKQSQGRTSLLFQPSAASGSAVAAAASGANSQPRSDSGPEACLREQLAQRMLSGGAPHQRPHEDGKSPLRPPAHPPPLPPKRPRQPLSARPNTSDKSQARRGQAQKVSAISGKGSLSARASPPGSKEQAYREVATTLDRKTLMKESFVQLAHSLEDEQELPVHAKRLDWLDKRINALAGDRSQEYANNDALGELLDDATFRESGMCAEEWKYIKQIKSLEAELRMVRSVAQQARERQASHFIRRQSLEEFFLRCMADLQKDVTRKKGLLNPSPRPSTTGHSRNCGPLKTSGTQMSSKDSNTSIPEKKAFDCQNSERDAVVEVLLGSEVLLVHLYRTLFPHRDYYHVDGNRPSHQIFQPYKSRKPMSADKVSDKEPLPSLSETSYDFLVLKELKNKRWGSQVGVWA